MAYPETPIEMPVPGEEGHLAGHLAWHLQGELNWTLVTHAFCVSSSEMVVIWIIFSIDFLVMCLALYGLCCMFRSDHTFPVFILNLFVSDIIQICVKPVLHYCSLSVLIFFIFYVYIISIIVNIGFMVCISMERYIMIKYPVWYRLHHTCRNLGLICLLVWTSLCGYMVINVIIGHTGQMEYAFILSVFLFLLPYPLVVFSFVGSWRALSHSVSVTPDEQKRILRILALVLFNYTVFFMPTIVQNAIFAVSFKKGLSNYDCLHSVSGFMLYLNPLADALLYVFIRKDATSMLKCSCCEKLHGNPV